MSDLDKLIEWVMKRSDRPLARYDYPSKRDYQDLVQRTAQRKAHQILLEAYEQGKKDGLAEFNAGFVPIPKWWHDREFGGGNNTKQESN